MCVPTLTSSTRSECKSLLVSNTNLLYANYNDRTNMIQLSAVIPINHHLELNKFMYTVKDNQKEEAIQFCKVIMKHVYKGMKNRIRVNVLN